MRLICVVLILVAGLMAGPARANECLAMAEGPALFQPAALQVTALNGDEVRITYVGHSTFVIETPEGVKAATDYSGFAGSVMPDLVTMNHAHSTHYTDFPDPAIKHVLRGWSDVPGEPAKHDVTERDMRVRNVPTDIRRGGGREVNGNSIFVFEVAGLCIGHLGHLHHELDPSHIAGIGRLDVVMVAVDGGMTLPVENVMNVLKGLNVSVILPMHARFSGSLERFVAVAEKHFKVERLVGDEMVVAVKRLPEEPTVFVMPRM
jgi:L-ascorbate metabolism protein UlaG (beta-lactamase superfamily)